MIQRKVDLNKINKKILKESIDILKKGGIIIYPTDTAYGLGCDATNENAIEKIFKIKQRARSKFLPVIVANLEMARNFFILNKKEIELAIKFWRERTSYTLNKNINIQQRSSNKGKLSLILKVADISDTTLAKNVIAFDGTVGVRVPFSVWPQQLSLGLERPIISTSANISGKESCYSIQDIEKSFKSALKSMLLVDMILNAGPLLKVPLSTIARVVDDKIELIRQGAVDLK